jgi:hypothetical protein
MMKPLQVFMNEDELERLEVWTRERGCTKSYAVRVAIRVLTQGREEDPLLRACGMIEGLPADLSARIDDYLEESFVAEKAASTYRRRRRQK